MPAVFCSFSSRVHTEIRIVASAPSPSINWKNVPKASRTIIPPKAAPVGYVKRKPSACVAARRPMTETTATQYMPRLRSVISSSSATMNVAVRVSSGKISVRSWGSK